MKPFQSVTVPFIPSIGIDSGFLSKEPPPIPSSFNFSHKKSQNIKSCMTSSWFLFVYWTLRKLPLSIFRDYRRSNGSQTSCSRSFFRIVLIMLKCCQVRLNLAQRILLSSQLSEDLAWGILFRQNVLWHSHKESNRCPGRQPHMFRTQAAMQRWRR